MEKYLQETNCIDFTAPEIQAKIAELNAGAKSKLEYIEKAFEFVRDEIPHSWDIGAEVVS